MDLNYTRDTTSGQEGLDLLSRIQGHRFGAAGDRDDGLGHRGPGGGSDAPRRARFRPEAVGKRAAADHRQDADRTEQRHPPRHAPGSGEPAAARRRRADADRRIAVHAAGAADDLARGAVGRQRADHRRARHRQGSGGEDAARDFAAQRQADGDGECRRPGGRSFRERVVRAREGRLHRREDGSRGALRAGRRRHAVSGRDRQRPA